MGSNAFDPNIISYDSKNMEDEKGKVGFDMKGAVGNMEIIN